MKSSGRILLSLLLLFVLVVLCKAADRSAQVVAVTSPKAVTVVTGGKAIKLEPNTELYTTVIRVGNDKDKDNLNQLQKDGKEPKELIVTDAGKVHIGNRDDLKTEAELKKLSKAGKLPPLYPAYKFQDNIVLLDGSLIVKTKEGEKNSKLLADFCKKNSLTLTARKDAKGVYILTPKDDSVYNEPFTASAELSKQDYVASAEPIFVILVKVDEEEEKDKKDKAKDKPKDKAKPSEKKEK